MFVLRRNYLTPKGRLSAQHIANAARASVSADTYEGVTIAIEAPDGSVYKIITDLAGADQLASGLHRVTDQIRSDPNMMHATASVPA